MPNFFRVIKFLAAEYPEQKSLGYTSSMSSLSGLAPKAPRRGLDLV